MFRAITLNLNYLGTRHGSWPERRPLVIDALRAIQPDVIALQAVWRTVGGDSQADELAREVPGYEYVAFQPAVEDAQGCKGLALLTREPLREIETRTLGLRAGTEDPDRRIVLRAHVGGLCLHNVHFSWVPEQVADNVREALPFLSAKGPALVLGDFNLPPVDPLHARFRDAGWIDAWGALRPADPGYTFEADAPSMRIDYVYVNGSLSARLRAVELVGAGRPAPPRLSDHLGLVVELELD
jgi:endonuclease/exonuclease/phosphatase family metal-dependent hydrolase